MDDQSKEEKASDSAKHSNDPLKELHVNDGPPIVVVDEASKEDTQAGGHLAFNPSHRHSVALLELDRAHSWLAEMDEKSANLETAFVSKAQYVALSNHFQDFLEHLRSKQDELPEVYGEFANLFQKFRTCFVGSQQLQNKVYELMASKADVDLKVLKLKSKVGEKEKEIEDLKATVESMRLDEADVEKEKMALQQEINNLKEDLSQRLDENHSDDGRRGGNIFLEEETEEEMKIQQLEDELGGMKEDFINITKREEIYERKILDMGSEIEELEKELTTTKSALKRNVVSLEKSQEDIDKLHLLVEAEKGTSQELREENSQLKQDIDKERASYKRLYEDLKLSEKVLDEKCQALDKLRRDFESRGDRMKLLSSQKDSLSLDLEEMHLEIKSLKTEKASILKQKKECLRKIAQLEKIVLELETQNESLREKNKNLEKELESMNKEFTDYDQKIKELTKQKDKNLEDLQTLDKVATTLRDNLKMSEERETLLKKDLGFANQTLQKLQNTIKNQELEQERSNSQITEQKKSIEKWKNETERLNKLILESEKKASQLKQDFEEKEVQYKDQVADTRFYHKSLLEAKHEIEQQSLKINMLDKYSCQLKSYNKTLDDKLKVSLQEKQAVAEQLGVVNEALKQANKNGADLTLMIRRKEKDEQQLLKQIASLETCKSNQEQTLKSMSNEKDVLVLKLQKKDGEIEEEKGKVKLLENDLSKLEVSLNDRIKDIKLLKRHLSEMYRNKVLMESRVEKMEATRQELIILGRDLQEQKLKVKSLEEELQKPTNFHRWRNLEGTDPDKAQMVAKCLELQRQLLKKSAELKDKEHAIQEKEEDLLKLREMVNRRSESGVDDELWGCRRELKSRMDRLKCLSAENNMYESTLGKYRNEIMMLKDELRKYKLAEFSSRKKMNLKT